MRVLVTYGSKMGGTEGIAAMIGGRLGELGFDVDVRAARDVNLIDPYDAVIIGGGLYANRWYKEAAGFVKRHRRALRGKTVWMFSSGPLDDTATESTIPPTKQVQKYMDLVGAGGHMTFGGKLDADVKGFPASSMAKDRAGDYRDPAHVHDWVETVAAELTTGQAVR